jgi:thiosulfate reductase / polysulfide reductase chain A
MRQDRVRLALAVRQEGLRRPPVDPLPVYVPRDWQPSPEFPLYLINWQEASHTHSRTQNNEWLLELKPFAPFILHPDTVARHGIADGEEIIVESPHGQVQGRVKPSKRMHPEVIGLQHGFGHTAMGSRARGRGCSDSVLRPTRADTLAGMALHKEACVRIRRV